MIGPVIPELLELEADLPKINVMRTLPLPSL
jgi:hypothetical protein